MRAAIYARVSTPRQGREQTIESQLDALKSWANGNGYELSPEDVYTDEGYAGSRGSTAPGWMRCVTVPKMRLSGSSRSVESGPFGAQVRLPQVLLLEEFKRCGCEVVFLHHPISDDPNDQLLLQIRRAIAEYERAVLTERF